MRLTFLESSVLWLVALGCAGVAVGALEQFGINRAGVGIAALSVMLGYSLVTRSLGAVMFVLVAAILATLFGALMVANGSVSTGLAIAAGSALVTGVLGRAVLRELEWWG